MVSNNTSPTTTTRKADSLQGISHVIRDTCFNRWMDPTKFLNMPVIGMYGVYLDFSMELALEYEDRQLFDVPPL